MDGGGGGGNAAMMTHLEALGLHVEEVSLAKE